MSQNLTDRIYEAATVPELWPSVLDGLNEVGDGYATFLVTATREGTKKAQSRHGAYSDEYLAEGWPGKTDRAFRLLAAQHAGFLGDLDVYTREEMGREPGHGELNDVQTTPLLIARVSERSYSKKPVDGWSKLHGGLQCN